MLPSILSEEISKGLKSFITTGFETKTPFFAGMFQRFVEQPGNLMKGPYLSVALPFQQGSTNHQDFFSGFKTEFPPYHHQEEAWQRLRSSDTSKSTLIATGTGSGKTECFLYPLLDHCLQQHGAGQTRGIKAIVIYPMNALATDQAKRFAELIHHASNMRGKLRVGLFVGEGEENPSRLMALGMVITDKNELRKNPPDILLTNYKMLDFLLLRPGDQKLWRYNQADTLRYLVVDELHTFDGAQGTDLACLIRRLKARLNAPEKQMICVGTSATLGSGDEQEALRHYAEQIFQSDFENQSIISESRQSMDAFLAGAPIKYVLMPTHNMPQALDPDQYDTMHAYLAAQYALLFPDEGDVALDDVNWRIELGKQLKQHQLFYNLLRSLTDKPKSLDTLSSELNRSLPASMRDLTLLLINSLCALISIARDEHEQPLVNLRMQLWVRELRRIVTPLRKPINDEGKAQPLPLTFADDQKQTVGNLYLPLVQCTHCHATAWLARKVVGEHGIQTDLRSIYQAFFANDPESIMLLPLVEDEHEPDWKGAERYLCAHCGQLQKRSDGTTCLVCGESELHRVFEPVMTRQTSRGLVSDRHCPVCSSQDSMMVFGSRAASLSSVAIHRGFASAYNDDKKLIAFSDGVQDAAHRAGFFESRTWQHNMRMAIAQAIPEQGMALSDYYHYLPKFWRDRDINSKALEEVPFICEFIAPNMLWYRDYVSLTEQGVLPDENRLAGDIGKRMEWEVLAEFGYRARIGRSLEQTITAAMGFRLEPIEQAVSELLQPLQEDFGVRHIGEDDLLHFLLGLLLYLKQRGAICHRFLDAYITSGGKNFLLTRQSYLPQFTDYTASPVFLCGGNRIKKFDTLTRKNGKTWYQSWFYKALGKHGLLADNVDQDIYPVVLNKLVRLGVLNEMESKGDVVWGLNPDYLYLSREPVVMETASQRDRLVMPKDMVEFLCDMPSIAMHDDGFYKLAEKSSHWLTRLYLQGDIHRVIAREHTGLLSREERERVENAFMSSENRQPWSPNLLSATPTLEMGIDIGDLSSVLLCSVPPAQANYLQRIGRAGRKDGNAFNMTVAAGAPHDLYFYADPAQMMAGKVEPPGVFLNASTVIKRQLTAYCMDCWVATGIDVRAVPARLKPVLDHVEQGDLKQFPYNFIGYVSRNAPELLEAFLRLFSKELSERSKQYLNHFLLGDAETGAGTDSGTDGLELYLVKRLFELVKERTEIKSRVGELGRYLKKLEKMPQDESTQQLIRDVGQERGGLQAILREINGKQTMNFLTDEGLLPNYAFPEAGVTLRSVIFRKKDQVDADGKSYENVVYEYERAGAMAIGELAPENTFYAGGRKVAIQQVDLNLSEIETWRFCPACSHSEKVLGDDTPGSCPRCKNIMWADAGQQVRMLRLRQVMANTSDRDSRIGDDSDNREPTFYTRQMLADFDRASVEAAWKIKSDRLPFGFEFIRKATFREMNFGERGGNTQLIHIAGEEASRPGFKLCRHCGMIQGRRNKGSEQIHAYACKVADKTDERNLIDCLYLYREFTSEALRILLPVSTVEGGDQSLNSFIAALQLGLKLKFGGKVDHLRVMDYAEPISELASDGIQTASDYQRRYLMLYDSVPGGTGYLHELMQTPSQLLDVFRQARDVMSLCACNHDADKDGCYSCLYAFRNSHGMETTSRTTAVDLFSRILDLSDQFETVKSIDEITVNPVLDSELEVRFVEAIKRIAMGEGHGLLGDVRIHQDVVNGKPGYFLTIGERFYTIEPQVNVNMDDGVGYASKPDFMICSARTRDAFKPVALFMDGYKYHKDKVTDDSAKRMALVQSGHFWQWSLTWDDVHREFSKSHTGSRNPFAEELHASMKPLRDALAAKLPSKLDMSAFEAYASSSPLMQLLLFLQQPETDKWRDYSFTRVLGWFDQDRMLALDDVCKEYFNSRAPTRLNQLLDDAGQCAFGGIGLDDATDPLQILCAAPLEAIKSVDTEKMISSVYLNTDMTSDASFKRAWQGFLKAYNLMQFLPMTAFGTHDGVITGVYEPIEWSFAEGLNEDKVDGGYSPEAAIVLEEVLDEYRDGVKQLFEYDLPLPTVAYEVQDEHGEIIAEAELAWIAEKCVAMLAEQSAEFKTLFIDRGWDVVELDEGGQWLNSVREYLQEGE